MVFLLGSATIILFEARPFGGDIRVRNMLAWFGREYRLVPYALLGALVASTAIETALLIWVPPWVPLVVVSVVGGIGLIYFEEQLVPILDDFIYQVKEREKKKLKIAITPTLLLLWPVTAIAACSVLMVVVALLLVVVMGVVTLIALYFAFWFITIPATIIAWLILRRR